MTTLQKNQGRDIFLRAKKNVFTQNSGANLSKFFGDGLDFCEVRNYQEGDELRKINHFSSAKTGELQTNIFNETKQINVVIAIPLIASLLFGTKKLKTEVIAEIIATLTSASLQQKNQTQVIFFAQDLWQVFNIKNDGDIFLAVQYILDFDLKKSIFSWQEFTSFLHQKNKYMLFLLSDFYYDFKTTQSFKTIAKKHQIINIMVRDKLEEYPFFGQNLTLTNPENNYGNEVLVDKKMAKKYHKKLQIFDKANNSELLKYKIHFGKILTTDNVFLSLLTILK